MGGPVSVTDQVGFLTRVFGSYNLERGGANAYVRCPRCAPPDPNKRKLGIRLDDWVWHCYTCGRGGRSLWPLVAQFGTRDQLLEYRDNFLPDDQRNRTYLDDVDAAVDRVQLPDDFRLLATATGNSPDLLAARKYLAARHVTVRDQWYFRLGYSNDPRWRRRIIVPSFDAQGDLNHFVGRAIDPRRWPRYDMPSTSTASLVFNELNLDWASELVVCEGTFDLMKCPDNAVPLLGSDIGLQSALFNRVVAHNTPVALALDADMRLTKMPRVARRLMEYNVPVRVVHVPTDPGDMMKVQFKQALATARPFAWDDAFLDRLEQVTRTRL